MLEFHGDTKIYRAGFEDRPGAEVRRRQQRPADARQNRRQELGPAEASGRGSRHRSGRPTCSSCRPRGRSRPASASSSDTPWQREFDASFPYTETPDQLSVDRGDQGRHAAAAADGPPALRRRRLWQNRAGHAGRVQGRRQRLPGGRAGADDDSGRAASADVYVADGGVSVHDRVAVPLLHAEGAEGRFSKGWPTARSTS